MRAFDCVQVRIASTPAPCELSVPHSAPCSRQTTVDEASDTSKNHLQDQVKHVAPAS